MQSKNPFTKTKTLNTLGFWPPSKDKRLPTLLRTSQAYVEAFLKDFDAEKDENAAKIEVKALALSAKDSLGRW